MKVCSVRKCWKARVLGAGKFTVETDFRIDPGQNAGKLGGCHLGALYKETTPFLPPWKVLNIGRIPFQMDFFPESVGSHKTDLI